MSESELQAYTLKELSNYDGNHGTSPALLLGLNGKVYDVSSGANFYGPGKAYNVLAGRDSTRALAKASLKAEDIPGPDDDPVDAMGLSESELETLKGWEQRLAAKYAVCGRLVSQ
ncbi:Dihydrodipicolinate synthase [Coemansia erecta]|uniref:Dihydrodipicolinate synthase n=1 Tax=Coemansia asiatica TaxID=1052880 RepID=A0A9W7XFK0_9FUNG|nr:Dihydrodipicolinate synthase [Coemansia asiatica]KAJ2842743.1 Dihydrodipicolinate synthase [Coemansia erecta]KAJ2886309.1 Dihydrodipicolinate synthase [Coemansia asiatica]